MKKKTILILLIISALLSCKKDLFLNKIDYEIPMVPGRLTISCKLKNGEKPLALIGTSVHISSDSTSINDSNFVVKLFEDNLFIENLFPVNGLGYYGGNHTITKNHIYQLTVSRNGFNDATGSTLVPDSVQFTDYSIQWDSAQEKVHVSFKIIDPLQTSDYYLIEPYSKDSNDRNRTLQFATPDPTMEDFSAIDGFLGGITPQYSNILHGGVYRDQYFNGQLKEVQLTLESYFFENNILSTVYLRISRISKGYYEFDKSMNIARSNEILGVIGEPVQIFSNIQGGYGVVASSTAISIELKP